MNISIDSSGMISIIVIYASEEFNIQPYCHVWRLQISSDSPYKEMTWIVSCTIDTKSRLLIYLYRSETPTRQTTVPFQWDLMPCEYHCSVSRWVCLVNVLPTSEMDRWDPCLYTSINPRETADCCRLQTSRKEGDRWQENSDTSRVHLQYSVLCHLRAPQPANCEQYVRLSMYPEQEVKSSPPQQPQPHSIL